MTRIEKGRPAFFAKVMALCVLLRTLPSSISATTRILLMIGSPWGCGSEDLGFGLELLNELRHGLDLDAGLAGGRKLRADVLDLEGRVAREVRELRLDEGLLLRGHDGHERGEANAFGVLVRRRGLGA